METMAIKTGERELTEAEIYAPDLDEGVVDVETYLIPDGSEIADPYLQRIWAGAKAMIEADGAVKEPIEDKEEPIEDAKAPEQYAKEPEDTGFDEWLQTRHGDPLPGGVADSLPDSAFDPAALAKGVKVELEHADDPDVAREIASDHLSEDPDYYEKLAFMESGQEVPSEPDEPDSNDPDDSDASGDSPEDDPADTLADRVAKAARKTLRKPSDEQKAAGNYRKGKCRLHGLEVAIETPQGATRSGKNKTTGKEWSIKMPYHYGYIKRTESEADGDHIDVFLGPDLDSEVVFVIDQVKPGTGRHFDEHKCMLGWKSADAAKAAYHECYQDGWQGFEAITPMTLSQFREWCERGDTGKRVSQ